MSEDLRTFSALTSLTSNEIAPVDPDNYNAQTDEAEVARLKNYHPGVDYSLTDEMSTMYQELT